MWAAFFVPTDWFVPADWTWLQTGRADRLDVVASWARGRLYDAWSAALDVRAQFVPLGFGLCVPKILKPRFLVPECIKVVM